MDDGYLGIYKMIRHDLAMTIIQGCLQSILHNSQGINEPSTCMIAMDVEAKHIRIGWSVESKS
ncbi:MAG: hypothetical protein ACLTDF_08870 [Coprococcus sp.]